MIPFRICPKCGKSWSTLISWIADTKEMIDLAAIVTGTTVYERPGMSDRRYPWRIRKNVREHVDCGGQMYDQGEELRPSAMSAT